MNRYPHPRPLTVLRRARGSLASSGQNSSDASLSTLHIRHWRATAPLHPAFKQTDPTQLNLLLITLHPLGPIQNT
jgi:hypothetical protein